MTDLYPYNLRSGNGVQLTVLAEDEWEASKHFRQLTRQGYIKRGRFTKSMKPLFFDGYIQVSPGIPIDEYEQTTEECKVCNDCDLKKLNPDYLNAELIHCSDCNMTMIRKRNV